MLLELELHLWFENDVEMYGAQTKRNFTIFPYRFENDVEMYGAQTIIGAIIYAVMFENDVEMYGAQTKDCRYKT